MPQLSMLFRRQCEMHYYLVFLSVAEVELTKCFSTALSCSFIPMNSPSWSLTWNRRMVLYFVIGNTRKPYSSWNLPRWHHVRPNSASKTYYLRTECALRTSRPLKNTKYIIIYIYTHTYEYKNLWMRTARNRSKGCIVHLRHFLPKGPFA